MKEYPKCPKCGKTGRVTSLGVVVRSEDGEFLVQDFGCRACRVLWEQIVEWKTKAKIWQRV